MTGLQEKERETMKIKGFRLAEHPVGGDVLQIS